MHHTKGTCGSQQRSKTFATNTWPSQINKYLKKKTKHQQTGSHMQQLKVRMPQLKRL